MRNLLALIALILLTACGAESSPEDNLNVTSKFNSTWNIYESSTQNDDGSITYKALPWGGLVGEVKKKNMPVDWSSYESITFDFSEPTTVPTQIMISEKLKSWGKAGISSLTCYFDGQDVTSVDQVMLQASDTCSVTVNRVYLTPNDGIWESIPLWRGNCSFGNWENGFVVKAEKFNAAYEGNRLEFVFKTDKSNPDVTYWLFKTIYAGTDSTLEGNASELNNWGCAFMGSESTVYRIFLTANDVNQLRQKGLFVNGFYNIVTECNLWHKTY